ncbi:MAG: hypothetical protein CO108_23165 [Deltaproteobacteria bacterium CG_4_9_14_3_um_filter_63_12]|nr:MAG: hypothetical protein CO108_23165 [Deltaproteobacteria bacterium CG_4_9_14_3_um_filter_63_12]
MPNKSERSQAGRWIWTAAFAAVLLVPAQAFASEGGGSSWSWYWQVAGGIVNFSLLAYVIIRFGGPKVALFLDARKDRIEKEMSEAARLREEAQTQLDTIEAKMKVLDEERQRLMDDYRAAGNAEKERIIASAEAQAFRIKEEARLTAETETSRARAQVEREMIELSLQMAESTLREQMKPAKQTELIKKTIDSLSALGSSAS